MIRRTFEALGSGIAVYGIMAACSSDGGPSLPKMLGLDAGRNATSDPGVRVSDAGAHRDASTHPASRDATVPVAPGMPFPNPQMPGSVGPVNPSSPLAILDASTAPHLLDSSATEPDGGRRPRWDASMTSTALWEAGTPRTDSGLFGGLLDAMIDPIPDAMANQTSGTRIKLRWWTTADGLKSFAGWRDVTLNIDCTPTRVGWEHRCLPVNAAMRVFSDSACTRAAFVPYEYMSADPPRFFVLGELGYRSYDYTSFEAGATIPGDAPLFTLSGATCTEMTDETRESYERLGSPREGHPVPISTFALVTPTVD